MILDLAESRRRASELSGGISSEPIKSLILRLLDRERAAGSLLDYGAGTGELLVRLHSLSRFDRLAGADLFSRPASLPAAIEWHRQDLNDAVSIGDQFDTVDLLGTIERPREPAPRLPLAAPPAAPGGLLVLTMPNQESIRSYAGLIFAGHFTHFLGACYPAHITALLRMDLTRLCAENGFAPPQFAFTDDGAIPKLATVHWQQISLRPAARAAVQRQPRHDHANPESLIDNPESLIPNRES